MARPRLAGRFFSNPPALISLISRSPLARRPLASVLSHHPVRVPALALSRLVRPSMLSQVYNVAYLRVHSFASSLYRLRSVLYTCAISGTKGSSGFGSVSREQMLRSTLLIVNAGDHCSFKISKQIDPWLFTFGWYTFVLKLTFGGLKG